MAIGPRSNLWIFSHNDLVAELGDLLCGGFLRNVESLTWSALTFAGRFLGFSWARVFGIRPKVEGVQSVANWLEQFGLRPGHAFFLRDFHRRRVLFPSLQDFNFLFARKLLA